MNFINEDKFVGIIAPDWGNFGLDEDFSEQVTNNMLVDLLGYDVYKAMEADLDGNGEPQTQIYIDLVDGKNAGWTDGNGYLRKLEGIKEMLPFFYFAKYIITRQFSQTSAGMVEPDNVNAAQSKQGLYSRYVQAYNAGLVMYWELQDYLLENISIYENYHTKYLAKLNVFGIC